ncbi:MAG: hypothetical protein M3133_07890, partial [Actinomycetota bacterium]|nr:hypothetical protein [Actinomycetota bacterium]
IPLALELAAARVRSLSPAQIARRLDDRFGLLTTGDRSALARQQTLQAAVDWSHDLLTVAQRTLFRRLSVFRGLALEAAEAVCADDTLPAATVAAVLGDLVDRSLVVTQPLDDASLRYSLLETLRDYAADRLAESGEEDQVRRRHFEWGLELGREFRSQHLGQAGDSGYNERQWYDRMQLEHDNFRQSLGWALEAEPVGALQLANDLGQLWRVLGHLHEGRRWLKAAVTSAPEAPVLLRARALGNDGAMAAAQGDFAAAWPRLQEATMLARELAKEDSKGTLLLGMLLPGLGLTALYRDDLDAAQSLMYEGLLVNRQIGHRWNEGAALVGLGRVATTRSDFTSASVLLHEALGIFEQVGLDSEAAECRTFLARVRLLEGDPGAAATLLASAVPVLRSLGTKRGLALALGVLGELRLQLGECNQARKVFEEQLSVAREIGIEDCEAEALRGLERTRLAATLGE